MGAERVKLAAPSDRAEQANLLLRLRLVVLRRMIRDGRLRPLTDPRALDLRKRDRSAIDSRVRRDPQVLLDLLLSALPSEI